MEGSKACHANGFVHYFSEGQDSMTINITVITPDYVLQASDRLMTAIAGGGYDDDAN
jgi:hypothetical protein